MPHLRHRLLLVLACIFCLAAHTHAQKAKTIEIVGDTLPHKDIFIVGEIHTNNELPYFSRALIDFVRQQYGVNNIVYEKGPSLAYLLNMYMRHGDTTCFLYSGPAYRRKLDEFREINKTLPPGKQICIYGADFDRMEFVAATRLILNKNPAAANTALRRYVTTLPDSILTFRDLTASQRKARNATYKAARHIFTTEKNALMQAVTTDYDVLEAIYENEATERHFAKRDKAMYHNIKRQLSGKKYIFIAGRMHTTYHNGATRRSVARRLWQDGTRYTSIVQVCKASYGSTQWYHSATDTGGHLYPASGPGYIIKNDSIMHLAFSKYYRPGYFSLINAAEFKPYTTKTDHNIPTYYAFFDYPVRD